MDLPTYTNIWRIEKRLYKLYDFRLPMPLPINWIAVFAGITIPYIVLLIAIGLPFNHTLVWLYVLPPGLLTWLTTRPVIENKRLPELVESQLRYVSEPRTWVRLAPLSEKDQVVLTAKVWHSRPARKQAPVPAARPAADRVALTSGVQVRQAQPMRPGPVLRPTSVFRPSQEAGPATAAGPLAHEPAAQEVLRRAESAMARPGRQPEQQAGPRVRGRERSRSREASRTADRARAGGSGRGVAWQPPVLPDSFRVPAVPAAPAPPDPPSQPAPPQPVSPQPGAFQHPSPAPRGPQPVSPRPDRSPAALAGGLRPAEPPQPYDRGSGPVHAIPEVAPPAAVPPAVPLTPAGSPPAATPEVPVPAAAPSATPGTAESPLPAPPDGLPLATGRVPAPATPSGPAPAPGAPALELSHDGPRRRPADAGPSPATPVAPPVWPSLPGGQIRLPASDPVAPAPAPAQAAPPAGQNPSAGQPVRLVPSVADEAAAPVPPPDPVRRWPVAARPLRSGSRVTGAQPAQTGARPPVSGARPAPGDAQPAPAEAQPASKQATPRETPAAEVLEVPGATREAGNAEECEVSGEAGAVAQTGTDAEPEAVRSDKPAERPRPAAVTQAGLAAAPAAPERSAPAAPDTEVPSSAAPKPAETAKPDTPATPEPAPAPERPPTPAPLAPPVQQVTDSRKRSLPSIERALSAPGRDRNGSWGGKVKLVTGNGAAQGPGARDQEAMDRNRARGPVAKPKRILVLGCTSGAGQSVTALMTASILASLREHPVAAVDLHDGALARYRAPAAWLDELVAGQPPHPVQPTRADGLHPTPKPSAARLDVIAAHEPLAEGDESRMAYQLGRHYPLSVLDPGAAGLTRLLQVTDQLVVVVPANADAAGTLADFRDWLDGNGQAELAMQSVTVINGVSRRSLPDVEHAESVARGRSRAIVRVPWDDMLPVAATGPATLRPQTRVAYTALAGVLVAGLSAAPSRKKQP